MQFRLYSLNGSSLTVRSADLMESSAVKIERPIALVILDGWGYAPRTDGNAISIAHTPNYDEICRTYPMTTLQAAGSAVGLDESDAGDAEVGHLTMGTGRIASTESGRIKDAIASGEFMSNPVLNRAFARAKAAGSAVHLIGLLSDGGVHSNLGDLFAVLRLAKAYELENVFIHCILDGVDVTERTADVYVEALEIKLADIGIGRIASMIGRFFAMDDQGKWERTARAFTMLVHAEGERVQDALTAVRNSFLRGISDEFIAPIVVESEPEKPVATIKDGDLVVFVNHRGDAMQQLVRSICVPEGNSAAKPSVETVCLVEYDRSFNLPAAFRQDPPKNTLIETLSQHEILNVKVTDASRFIHLSNYFEGGRDPEFSVEHQVLINSRNGSGITYPEGLSFKITDQLLRAIDANPNGVFIADLSAAVVMAETGDLAKTIEAIQYLDTCLGGIRDKIERLGGHLLITSSHGNCEQMIDTDSGEPDPRSTQNPVPFHFVSPSANGTRLRDDGTLADIAPTLLSLANITKPNEMSGNDLRVG